MSGICYDSIHGGVFHIWALALSPLALPPGPTQSRYCILVVIATTPLGICVNDF